MTDSRKLVAFRPHAQENTTVIAAYEPQEVIDMINARNAMFEDGKGPWCSQVGFSVETVVQCSEEQLDAPNTTPFGAPAESLRELLAQATKPQVLRDWD
jgi:hypothetical protein